MRYSVKTRAIWREQRIGEVGFREPGGRLGGKRVPEGAWELCQHRHQRDETQKTLDPSSGGRRIGRLTHLGLLSNGSALQWLCSPMALLSNGSALQWLCCPLWPLTSSDGSIRGTSTSN